MIDLDFSKLLLVAVIALVILGPEKLPKAARMAGKVVRRLRMGWESVRSEVERELEMEDLRRAAKEAVEQAEAARKAADESLRAVRESVSRETLDLAKPPVTVTGDSPAEEVRHGDA